MVGEENGKARIAIWASGAVPIKNRHVPLKTNNLELWTNRAARREDR
jgi:hypothetical protein